MLDSTLVGEDHSMTHSIRSTVLADLEEWVVSMTHSGEADLWDHHGDGVVQFTQLDQSSFYLAVNLATEE